VDLTIEVELLAAGAPLGELPDMVNAAFAAGEDGLWQPGTYRIAADELRRLVDRGELVVARREGVLAGCMRLRPLDAATAELGLLTAARDAAGAGVGRALMAFAEDRARAGGQTAMRLRLLVPREGTHPFKARLHAWYTRLGYRVVGRLDFAVELPELAALLTTPCDLVVYEKRL
jgi:GNAT superfamily N-acetyltransferase